MTDNVDDVLLILQHSQLLRTLNYYLLINTFQEFSKS